jgi:hypothetical protein
MEYTVTLVKIILSKKIRGQNSGYMKFIVAVGLIAIANE